jgi:hypothetical protein
VDHQRRIEILQGTVTRLIEIVEMMQADDDHAPVALEVLKEEFCKSLEMESLQDSFVAEE